MVDSKKDSDKQLQFPHGELGTKPTNEVWIHSETKKTRILVKRLPRPKVVSKVYLQKRTSDFSFFSPTASQVTLRVILALTAMLGFKSWDLDTTCSFISVPLPKGQKLYPRLKSIEGYPLAKGKLLKLLKNYGLILSHTSTISYS
jgi:hypothetical protein